MNFSDQAAAMREAMKNEPLTNLEIDEVLEFGHHGLDHRDGDDVVRALALEVKARRADAGILMTLVCPDPSAHGAAVHCQPTSGEEPK